MKVTPWTPIEATDVAAGAPDSAGLNMALRDNAKHCQQITYDEDIHTAPTGSGHAHRGDESSHVGKIYPNTPNLLGRLYATNHETEEVDYWLQHGVTATPAGFGFSSSGQWASQCVGDATRPASSLAIFGAGAHLVISAYLIADRTLEVGSMQFGLSTGGGKAKTDDERSFIAGGRIDVPAQVITTTWRRFWAVIDTEGVDFSNSVRFTVQCRGAFGPLGATVYANLFDLRVGQLLDYPALGYVVDSTQVLGLSVGDGNEEWSNYGYAPVGGPPPPLDHAMAITNAIKLKAR